MPSPVGPSRTSRVWNSKMEDGSRKGRVESPCRTRNHTSLPSHGNTREWLPLRSIGVLAALHSLTALDIARLALVHFNTHRLDSALFLVMVKTCLAMIMKL